MSRVHSAGPGSGTASSESQNEPAAAGVAVQIQQVYADTISTENKVSGRVVTDGRGEWRGCIAATPHVVYGSVAR